MTYHWEGRERRLRDSELKILECKIDKKMQQDNIINFLHIHKGPIDIYDDHHPMDRIWN